MAPITNLRSFTTKNVFYTIFSRSLCVKNDNLLHPESSSKYYDIIISGGGMVGTAMACSLGKSQRMKGKKILLLEASPLNISRELPANYSNRVSALSPTTVRLMQNLGVWDGVQKKRFQNVKRMQVWDACSDAMITFNFEDMSKEVAVILENNLIKEAFVAELQNVSEIVEIQDSARIDGYKLPHGNNNRDLVEVYLKNGQHYETKLLIGADGARSTVRSTMNINHMNWSYNQMAVVATLHLSETLENNTAWQRFLPSSTIALLPLSSQLSSLVWSTSTSHAKSLINMDEESFVKAVNAALWDENEKNYTVTSALQQFTKFLHNIIPEGQPIRQLPPSIVGIDSKSRAGFQLGFGHATHYIAPRVALIGDAAHRIHPHAGLGANLGFGDITCLTRVIENTLACGCDIGSLNFLKEYEQVRQKEVVPVMAVVECLHRLFVTSFSPIVMLRSIGLYILNSTYPVKDYLMSKV